MKNKFIYIILFSLISNLNLAQGNFFMEHTVKYTSLSTKKVSLFEKSNLMIIRRPNNFDEGLVWYNDLGFSGRHISFNTSLAWQTYGGWEWGAGLGIHSNELDIPINNENGTLNISGMPVFIFGKYFLANFFEGIIKPYVKTSIGFSFNNTEEGTSTGSGVMFENGIGVQFRIGRDYIYCDYSQYNLRSRGSVVNPDDNLNLSYKLWFNDLVFRIGYGRRFIY